MSQSRGRDHTTVIQNVRLTTQCVHSKILCSAFVSPFRVEPLGHHMNHCNKKKAPSQPPYHPQGGLIGICIYRRLGGESNREIVFVSFVRACVRSCVCLRGTMLLPIAGVPDVRKSSVSAFRVLVPFPLCRNVKVIEKLLWPMMLTRLEVLILV